MHEQMAWAPARLHLAEPYALRRNVASSLIAAPEAPKTKTQRSCRCAPIERNVATYYWDEVVRGISIWSPKLCITAGGRSRGSREKVGFTAVLLRPNDQTQVIGIRIYLDIFGHSIIFILVVSRDVRYIRIRIIC